MKKNIFLLTIFLNINIFPSFDEFFYQKTLRIDFYHTGNSKEEVYSIDKFYLIDGWAGPLKNLIDPSDLGKYKVEISTKNDLLIYSYNFDSIFAEYQTTKKAIDGIKKTFSETILIPYPKDDFKIKIKKREKRNKYLVVFEESINLNNIFISKEKRKGDHFIWKKDICGNPSNCVDIVILADGYTKKEKKKAVSDFEKFYNIFFSQEPYKSFKGKFNFYGIFVPSEESGCDEPSFNIWKSTPFGTSFDSLDSERYILSEENKNIRDWASLVPYDSILIMINHKRYGGGGIYNLYATFTADNLWNEYLMLHEFGHSFAGLADEYYTSSTSYENFYKIDEEPAEPNITALLEGEPLKWASLILKDTPIPTPWEKDKFDSIDLEYQKERERLNKEIREAKKNKEAEKIKILEEEINNLTLENYKKLEKFFKESKWKGIVGAYEGAGYQNKGLYRPEIDCIMFSRGKKPYCKVCKEAIIKRIKFLTE
jgi:hypothetical protein